MAPLLLFAVGPAPLCLSVRADALLLTAVRPGADRRTGLRTPTNRAARNASGAQERPGLARRANRPARCRLDRSSPAQTPKAPSRRQTPHAGAASRRKALSGPRWTFLRSSRMLPVYLGDRTLAGHRCQPIPAGKESQANQEVT